MKLSKIAQICKKHTKLTVMVVRHGEWEIKEELYVECPFCKRTFWIPYEFEDEKILAYAREHYPYCNCGAKMDGATDNNVGGKQG